MATKTVIQLDDPNLKSFATLTLKIEGTSPLLMHRFDEKSKKMMRDKQQGKASASAKKAPKVPMEDFLGSIHFIGRRAKTEKGLKNARYGMPAVCFKAAAVRAAKMGGTPMTDARAMFFVEAGEDGELVEIFASEPYMREDPVRVQQTTDLRYRACFEKWGADLIVTYNARQVTAETLVSWFISAGIGNGIGEWRPGGRNSSGPFGRWKVVSASAEVPELTN